MLCELRLDDLRDLAAAVQRCRRLLDLDADQQAIDAFLGADPELGPLVAARPGLRVPGCADPGELAVRALVGGREAARLVHRYGRPLTTPQGAITHTFPDLATLAEPGVQGETVRALADGTVTMDVGADPVHVRKGLLDLPRLGEEAVACLMMRALRDPDVLLPHLAGRVRETWRPWRSYATQHLWADSP